MEAEIKLQAQADLLHCCSLFHLTRQGGLCCPIMIVAVVVEGMQGKKMEEFL